MAVSSQPASTSTPRRSPAALASATAATVSWSVTARVADPGRGGGRDQLLGPVAAVAGQRVGVQVDQGAPATQRSEGAVSSLASSQAITWWTESSTLSASVCRTISGSAGGS